MVIYYPHRRTVVVFAVCALLVGATAYHVSKTSQNGSEVNITPIVNVASEQRDLLLASSTDWRKQFLVNSATTSSGVLKNAAAKKPLTDTERLARDFFVKYVDLKQANLLDDQTAVNDTADALVTAHMNTVPDKVYTEKDLRIVYTEKNSDFANWGTSVEQAIALHRVTRNESAIMSEYFSNKNSSVLSGLDPVIDSYKKIIAKLVVTPVPSSKVANGVALLNSFSLLKSAAEALRVSDTDSVKGLSGINMHMMGIQGLAQAITDIQNVLRSNGVKFSPDQNILNMIIA